MKTQINLKSGNKQISDDDTVTQVQIGLSKPWRIFVIFVLIMTVVSLFWGGL